MHKEIILQVKNVYGNDLIYPSCHIANALIKLKAGKTFSKSDLKNLIGAAIELFYFFLFFFFFIFLYVQTTSTSGFFWGSLVSRKFKILMCVEI